MKVLTVTKERLEQFGTISIAFKGDSIYRLKQDGLKIEFIEESVPPFEKDFDVDEKPVATIDKFDCSNWGIILHEEKGKLICGALLAYNTKGVNMLEGRDDLVVVWNIRVNEAYRHLGYGSKMFTVIKEWAKEKGCKRIKIESQNNNVKACNFYMSQGATLCAFNKFAYKELPEEIQFFWNIDLT